MKIETFKVERWMNDYEDDAIYNLGETCIDSLTIGELLELSGVDPDKYLTGLKDKKAHIQPYLRLTGICGRSGKPI